MKPFVRFHHRDAFDRTYWKVEKGWLYALTKGTVSEALQWAIVYMGGERVTKDRVYVKGQKASKDGTRESAPTRKRTGRRTFLTLTKNLRRDGFSDGFSVDASRLIYAS